MKYERRNKKGKTDEIQEENEEEGRKISKEHWNISFQINYFATKHKTNNLFKIRKRRTERDKERWKNRKKKKKKRKINKVFDKRIIKQIIYLKYEGKKDTKRKREMKVGKKVEEEK